MKKIKKIRDNCKHDYKLTYNNDYNYIYKCIICDNEATRFNTTLFNMDFAN